MRPAVAGRMVGISLGLAVVLTGCATSRQVERRQGHGRKQVFAASFDQTWHASLEAVYGSRLTVLTTNLSREGGFISAGRVPNRAPSGENIGIWVGPTSTGQTKVEV